MARATRSAKPSPIPSGAALLLPYQQRWIDDPAPIKVIEKSRRIGLSYAEAADAVLHAANNDGANVYYISFNKEMTEGFVADCATWAKAFNLAAGEVGQEVFPDPQAPDQSILKYTLHFASGHELHAFSSNPRNLRSKGRPQERLIIDEAAFVDDLDELLKAALAMTIWGGQVHIISTHNGANNPFNRLIVDCRAGEYDYSVHRVTLDEALAAGLYRRICQVAGQSWSVEQQDQWRANLIKRYRPNEGEELFCIPRESEGKAIPGIWIERAMRAVRPVPRWVLDDAFQAKPEAERLAHGEAWLEDHVRPLLATLNPHQAHFVGMDFARYGNLTVIAPLVVQQDLTRQAPFLIELFNVPSRQQEQILWCVLDGLPNRQGVAMDATGPGLTLAEYTADRYGRPHVQEVILNDTWYREHIGSFVRAFEDGRLDLMRDADVAGDLRRLENIGGIVKLPKPSVADTKDQAIKRHGDAAIALALAYYASQQTVWQADWQAAPSRRSRSAEDEGEDEDDRPRLRRAGGW
jgi:phage FluMu gp28-like protein